MAKNKELKLLGTPDKIDRYRLILMGELKANSRDERYLDRINKAWSLLRAGYSRSEVSNMLPKLFEGDFSSNTAYRIIRVTEQIYGSVSKVDIEGKRALLDEHLSKIYRTAMEIGTEKALAVALLAIDRQAKLHGVYRPNTGAEADPNQFMLKREIVFIVPGQQPDQTSDIIDITDNGTYSDQRKATGIPQGQA